MKTTLLGGWVGSREFLRTCIAVTCALTSLAGCGASGREIESDDSPIAANAGENAGAGENGGEAAGTNMQGATGAASENGTSGDGASGANDPSNGAPEGGSDAAGDDPETPGNDSSEAAACADRQSCAYASQSCCVSGVGNAQCIEGGTCPTGGLIAPARTVCDGPEDCRAGQVCCVAVNPTGAKNSCQDSCAELSGLIGVWQLCHTDDDCPADKNACAADETFPFWGFCG